MKERGLLVGVIGMLMLNVEGRMETVGGLNERNGEFVGY